MTQVTDFDANNPFSPRKKFVGHFTIPCWKCGKMVERKAAGNKPSTVVCFGCKSERKKEIAKIHAKTRYAAEKKRREESRMKLS